MELLAFASPIPLAFLIWPLLGGTALLGLIAVVSPDTFAVIAQRGGEWVDTHELLQKLDERIDIDEPVLRYSRFFGAAVLFAAAILGYLYLSRGVL